MCNPFLGYTLIKTYSIQIPLRCHCGQRSLYEATANLGSPDTMIVTEVGALAACGATRHWSSGAEFAVASRDTRRFSAQGRALSTAPSGRRYASSGAVTCHRFPVRWREKYLNPHVACFYHATGILSKGCTLT